MGRAIDRSVGDFPGDRFPLTVIRDADRLECLSPLFELVSSLGTVPFKLQIDVHVTGPNSQNDDQNLDFSEKTVAEKDPEALSALPSLTRESSGSDATDGISETMGGAHYRDVSYRSLYTVQWGRPDIASTVRSFAADAEGESLAVAGQFKIRVPVAFQEADLSLISLRTGTTQCRCRERMCRTPTQHFARPRTCGSGSSFRGVHLVISRVACLFSMLYGMNYNKGIREEPGAEYVTNNVESTRRADFGRLPAA